MVLRCLPDEWWDCAMECNCYQRNVHNKVSDGKEASEKTIGLQFDRLLIPVEANVSCKPITSTDETRLHQLRKKMLPGGLHGSLYHVWEEDCQVDLPIADWKDLENLSAPIFPLNGSSTKKSHSRENDSFRARASLSALRSSSASTLRKCPPAETLSKMKAKKSTSWSKKKNGKYIFLSVSGDFIHRHHEVLGTELVHPG